MEIFNPEWIPWIWIVGGILLMISEFVVPGMFVVFIGLGVTITGIVSIFFHLTMGEKMLLLTSISIISILFGAAFLKNFFPSEVHSESLVKDEFRNEIVTVVEDILVNQKGGRIRYQGTEWDALTSTRRISKGDRVRILRRDNLTFIVEPLE